VESRVARTAVHMLYQLRHKLSAAWLLAASRVVNRRRLSCNERYVYTKRPTIGSFLQSFIVHHFKHHYMAFIQNCWMISTMHSCYIMLLSIVEALLQNIFFGEDDGHIMFLIPTKLLLWSDENAFCEKSCSRTFLIILFISFAHISHWRFIAVRYEFEHSA
jgi:hypothetical protein